MKNEKVRSDKQAEELDLIIPVYLDLTDFHFATHIETIRAKNDPDRVI